MTQQMLAPANAPRDINALAQQTRSVLYRLSTQIHPFSSQEEEQAFLTLSQAEQAQHVLALLQWWDQQNPGQANLTENQQPHALPQPPQAPPQAPPPAQMPGGTLHMPGSATQPQFAMNMPPAQAAPPMPQPPRMPQPPVAPALMAPPQMGMPQMGMPQVGMPQMAPPQMGVPPTLGMPPAAQRARDTGTDSSNALTLIVDTLTGMKKSIDGVAALNKGSTQLLLAWASLHQVTPEQLAQKVGELPADAVERFYTALGQGKG